MPGSVIKCLNKSRYGANSFLSVVVSVSPFTALCNAVAASIGSPASSSLSMWAIAVLKVSSLVGVDCTPANFAKSLTL